jgi:transcriptional regulator with XRE-family HTH domain
MLPNNIATYRKRAGLSQEQLADDIGTTRNMLVKLEKGSRTLNTDWLERIGSRLGVPPYLLIAPEQLLPNEQQLAEMLSAAQQSLKVDLPYSEWPRAVAGELHIRLRTLVSDLANAAASGA